MPCFCVIQATVTIHFYICVLFYDIYVLFMIPSVTYLLAIHTFCHICVLAKHSFCHVFVLIVHTVYHICVLIMHTFYHIRVLAMRTFCHVRVLVMHTFCHVRVLYFLSHMCTAIRTFYHIHVLAMRTFFYRIRVLPCCKVYLLKWLWLWFTADQPDVRLITDQPDVTRITDQPDVTLITPIILFWSLVNSCASASCSY